MIDQSYPYQLKGCLAIGFSYSRMDDVDDLELSADENLPPRKRRAFLFGRHSFSAALLKQPDPIEKLDASQGKNCSQNGQVSSPHARLGTNLDVQTALDELQPVERSHPQGVHSRQVVLSHQRDETIGGSQMLPLNRGGNNHTAIKKEAGCLEGSHNLALVSNSAIEEQEQVPFAFNIQIQIMVRLSQFIRSLLCLL